EEEVYQAVIETVAENLSDGFVAPLFYVILFGPVGGLLYKGINTLDSMIAYLDDRYQYFGYFAAKLDDLANYIPARLS
ncbi:CobD/CbiB family cobalamin biosynthesis protein, partial [Streptococcus anginosus]